MSSPRHKLIFLFEFIGLLVMLVLGGCTPSQNSLPAPTRTPLHPSSSPTITPQQNLKPSATPTQPLEKNAERDSPFGSLYFRLDDQMYALSAQCIVENTTCPLPDIVPNFVSHGTTDQINWSPKGDMGAIMVFPNRIENNIGELYLFDPAKNEGHNLTSGDYEAHLSWSPNGEWIAFSSRISMHKSGYSEANELYVIRMDGSDLHSITSELPGLKMSFAWVDSTTLAFTHAIGNYEDLTHIENIYSESIYTINISTNQLTRITAFTNLYSINMIGVVPVLPNNQIAFRAVPVGDKNGISKIYTLDLTTKGIEEFANTLPFWSPDGEWTVVIEGDDPLAMRSLVLMRGDGSESHEFLPLPPFTDSIIVWSPDSQSLIVIETELEQVLWFVPVTGSPQKINGLIGLTEGQEVLGFSWRPSLNP